jgi:phage tail-like protein
MPEYPITNFNFVVQLNIPNATGLGMTAPLCQMEFAEVDGLEMTMEPKTVREGGSNTRQTNLVGRVTYGNVTFKRGVTSNLDIWKWFAAATGSAARSARATGLIMVQDSAGQNKLRIDLFGCLPTKVKAPAFNAKDGQVAIEELQIAVTAFTVAPAA